MMRKSLLLPLAAVLSLLLSSCADLFQGKVSMATGFETASLSDVVVPAEVIEQLPSPRQLFVSSGDSPNLITVSWTPVSGALSYRLERAVVTEFNDDGSYEIPDESDYEVIPGATASSAKLYNTTAYTDQILGMNDQVYSAPEYRYLYFYRVCAENELKGYASSDYITSAAPGTLFAPPTDIQASAGSSETEVILSWEKSSSATVKEYSIYRSENEDGTNAAFITSVKSNMDHYADPIADQNRGVAYYYSVYAVNRSGVSSCASAIAMGYARAEGAPAQVTNVHVTQGRGESPDTITIAWDKAADADIRYAVYRSSSKDSALTLIQADNSSGTCSDSKNLSQNVYYYYQVQSWKYDPDDATKKIKGQLSDSGKGSASPCEGFILSAPASVSVTKTGAGTHTIIWTPAIGSDAEQSAYGYSIWGSDTKDSGFTEIEHVSAASLGALFDGEYYYQISVTCRYYKIRTVNGSESSGFSAVTAPAPYAPQSITVSRYANLSGEMGESWACNANEVYPVRVSWTPPSESDDVAGYIVYRSDKKDRGYKKLSVGNDEKTYIVTGTTFYDINTTARPGKIYYYRVLAVNALEQGVNYSDTAFGYGALTADQYMREYNKTVMSSQKKLTLMHKSDDMKKLGDETKYGTISGSLSYSAAVKGMGARIIMHYSDYADFFIHSNGKMDSAALGEDDETDIGTAAGVYFRIEGNTNTTASMDASGQMDGTVTCRGMYPGSVGYDGIQIKGGAAGGGYYVIKRDGFDAENVSWTVGNE